MLSIVDVDVHSTSPREHSSKADPSFSDESRRLTEDPKMEIIFDFSSIGLSVIDTTPNVGGRQKALLLCHTSDEVYKYFSSVVKNFSRNYCI